MFKFIVAIILLIYPSNIFAESNPMLGKWTAEKGDCSSFVTEYAPNAFFRITKQYLLLNKRKKYGGEISYKVVFPLVEFNWVMSGGASGMKLVHRKILRFEGQNTMREIFRRDLTYFNNELSKDEWEKEDGSSQYKIKYDGEWKYLNFRLGLKTLYRCN